MKKKRILTQMEQKKLKFFLCVIFISCSLIFIILYSPSCVLAKTQLNKLPTVTQKVTENPMGYKNLYERAVDYRPKKFLKIVKKSPAPLIHPQMLLQIIHIVQLSHYTSLPLSLLPLSVKLRKEVETLQFYNAVALSVAKTPNGYLKSDIFILGTFLYPFAYQVIKDLVIPSIIRLKAGKSITSAFLNDLGDRIFLLKFMALGFMIRVNHYFSKIRLLALGLLLRLRQIFKRFLKKKSSQKYKIVYYILYSLIVAAILFLILYFLNKNKFFYSFFNRLSYEGFLELKKKRRREGAFNEPLSLSAL